MIKEAFGTGATIEEAILNAKKELNAPENAEVKIETIDLPTKKILGLFGGNPAKVKAYYEVSNTDKALSYLKNILDGMGMTGAKINAKDEGEDLVIDLECGDDYGIIIGKRGETLDAIQYLTRLVINKDREDYKRVSINVGDYREKREKTLISLAHKNAARVAKYGKNVTLEPMNPFERRIIHTAVQDVEGVTSYSVGADAERRVVITLKEGVKPTNPGKGGNGGKYGKGGYKGGKGKGKGGYGKGRPYKDTDKPRSPSSAESRAPRTDAAAASVSRYGKIN